MSVIIRLQGLPWTASAMNIRHFFSGLNIPAGGVHIIGGEGGDAFIAFSSDEDARVAMKMNMSPLNGAPVHLFLSSKSEMQGVIDAARSVGPSTGSTLPASQNNMAAVGSQSGGMNPMGVPPSAGNTMPNQSQQMSGGYPGIPGQIQAPPIMNQKNNFPMMQQQSDTNPQGGANMASGMSMSNMGGGGMGGKNDWPSYPGMGGMGEHQIQNQSMMNTPQFQPNQMMMGGGQQQNDQFSRFQNMRQQYNNSNQAFPGAQGQNQRDMLGRQGLGPEMRGDGNMDVSGQSGHVMGHNHNQSRFSDPTVRQSPLRGGLPERPGQFAGVGMEDGMNQGFMTGQRAGSTSKDENKPIAGHMGDGSNFSKDKFSGSQIPGEQPGANTASWGAEKHMEDNFDKNRFNRDPSSGREQMFRQDMNRGEDPPFRREGRRWPNRFAEVPDKSDQQGPFGMGMNRADTDPTYPDGDSGMPDQFRDNSRSYQSPLPTGRHPDRAPGRLEGDRVIPSENEDGLPSTRYPPDDEPHPAMTEGGRPMGGRGLLDEPRNRSDDRRFMPGDRRTLSEERRGIPDDRRGISDPYRGYPEDRRPISDDRRANPEDHRAIPDDKRGLPEERRFRPRVSRFDRDETGVPIDQEERIPPNERPFPPEDRGFPGRQSRFQPSDRFGNAPDREFPGDDRFPPGRPFPESDGRIRGGDDRKFPPGKGRPIPDERRGMWPGDRPRPDDIRRRPDDNPFAPDDPRYREEEEMRREAFDRGPRGPDDRFMYGRGRGPMRGMGRPGGDNFGMYPFPPDRRGGYPPERHGGFREEDVDYPYGPDGYNNPDDPDRWRRFDRNDQRPDLDQKPGLLEKPDGGGKLPERAPLLDTPDTGGPLDMDQRVDKEMGPGRRPGMFREDEGFDYGRGPPMEEGYERGMHPRDFDSRAGGPRGRGGPMMDRPPRGRGRPGGMPPFGRGRGNDGDRFYEEQGMVGQDVDNRNMEGRFPVPEQPAMPEKPPAPIPGGRGLLGDGPGEAVHDQKPKKEEPPKPDAEKKDVDSRPPRRSDDRDRDRDRRNDDRRGRDRDERDRYPYRGRSDRDRERDRERRRSRSRSRDRDRGSRDKDGRYSKDNRDGRSSRDKSSTSDSRSDSTKSQRPTRFLLLKNMPPSVTFRDLRRFCQPMEIPSDGIKLINDKDGNRIGDAFIYFHRLDDAGRVQRKNGERMEGRPISIQFTTEDEFKKAVDSFVPGKPGTAPASVSVPATQSGNKTRYIVHMNNLPPTITRQDINTFFKNLKIEQEGEAAYIEFDQSGVATGVGFVEFKLESDYKKALTQDGTMLGTNKVKVSAGKAENADKLKAVQGEMFQRAALRSIANKTGANVGPRPPSQPNQNPQQPPQTTPFPRPLLVPPVENGDQDNVCVHIQGLPLLATHHDIRDFFSDCLIAVRGINIAHDGSGKPMGEGFVEFKFKSEVDKALKKDKTSLGRHIVAVKPIRKKEMQDRLQNAKHHGGGVSPKPPTSLAGPLQTPVPGPLVPPFGPPQVQKIPLPKPPGTQENPNRNMQPPPPQQQQQQQQPQQQQQQQHPQQQQPNQPNKNDAPQAPNVPPNQRPPPQQMANNNKGPMGPSAPLLQTPPQGPPLVVAPGGGKSFPPGVLNNNWFYVRCQNFPADISIAEIMQFFQTFRPIGESIRLHYSGEGQPTGNAVVGFSSAEDANRAMQRLNMMICRHNPVNLLPA